MNRCGGRTVPVFDRLSAQVAYVLAIYRHRPQTIAALEAMIRTYAEALLGAGRGGTRLPDRRGALHPRGPHRRRLPGSTAPRCSATALCDGRRVGVDVKAYDFIAAEQARLD